MSQGPPMLDGKVAIVTGAGSGIGRAVAAGMAAAGAAVVIVDIGVSVGGEGGSPIPAEQTRMIIEAGGGRAVVCGETVSRWDSACRIVETALDAFGRIDIVVNNAGILRNAAFHEMMPEDWLSVIGVHLNGSFFVSRAAAAQFRRQQSGVFVHMTGASALIGGEAQANYAAAKLGIVGLSRSIAIDMRRYNVRSNCVAPCAWTRMTGTPRPGADEGAEQIRVSRLQQIDPNHNVPLVVFLASAASGDVTGQIFAIRRNEIFVMDQSRPARSVQRNGGWTPELIRDHAFPALRGALTPLDLSGDVFCWDPV
ncbi:SDR family NAD(P)-dependent oxidoreductase [Acidocella sp. C78]|uniref:SDR family NAD(P)-dependent oxidoreductase n=1 Tax=Acidocella sp. C78 TaxID=1671486 RepID=UPI0020BF8A3A|nr:SDR family NAD(P)-dependent oxidoreductase [Acidocella sp. C78]